MKTALAITVFVLSLVSCSPSSKNEEGKVEVYSSYNCLSLDPTTTTPPDVFYPIPDDVLNIFKPTLVVEYGEETRDTFDLKTTKTDYRLMLRHSTAELEVKTNAKMRARVMHSKKQWYVFKTGVYQVNGVETYEVKQDGIYLVANGNKLVSLTNFRYLDYSTNIITSYEDFIKHYTTIAKGSASVNTFFVSKADTIYRCRRVSDKQIQLDMVSPDELDCTILEKE